MNVTIDAGPVDEVLIQQKKDGPRVTLHDSRILNMRSATTNMLCVVTTATN
jgi:hypothetical protein